MNEADNAETKKVDIPEPTGNTDDTGVTFIPATSPNTTDPPAKEGINISIDDGTQRPSILTVNEKDGDEKKLTEEMSKGEPSIIPKKIEGVMESPEPETEKGTPSPTNPLEIPSAPVLVNQPTSPNPESKLRSVRTFQADVAESIKHNKTSVVSVVLAEQARRQKLADLSSPKSKKNIAFIAISLILLSVGGISIYLFYKKSSEPAVVEVAKKIPSLVLAENLKPISVTGLSSEMLAKTISTEVNTANNKLDTIENVYFFEGDGKEAVPISFQRLLFFLDNRMPPQLLRSLNKGFMFGIHTYNGNHPFLLLQTNFYENTFAGMLVWEQYMARDLFPIFGIVKKQDSQVFLRNFEDRTIKNRDARILKDDNGDILMFYVFKDKNTLIITNSEFTMDEVMRRLNSSSSVIR